MNPRLAKLLEIAENHGAQAVFLGLERINQLLDRLQSPHLGLTPIHVAGTNGKGSVIAFLAEIFQQAGLTTGSYTSPHLARFNERIRLNGAEISDEQLIPLLERTLRACSGVDETYFEITTACALLHFAHLKPDITLLETGLGGRLDATSVVTPGLCLITPISLDHQAFLGESLVEIAREKAGIIKPGVAVVADPGSESAREVIDTRARSLGAPLILRGRDYDFIEGVGGAWTYTDHAGAITLPHPGLRGRHQLQNAALAVAAIRHLPKKNRAVPNDFPSDMAISEEVIRQGIHQARWPGRLEFFPGAPPIWLDGAHNPQGARVLKEALLDGEAGKGATLLIFSAFEDKDIPAMVRELAPLAQRILVVGSSGPRGLTGERIARFWPAGEGMVTSHATAAEALATARLEASPSQRVVVAGSLHLVGAVRSLLNA
ncbi:MAG: bifunctional folylpolyglutamate synthase/dihydrofolate synthase [Magnetococcales bacterium]|nr:bifunctional folylpolyglutamate synthase/dihydrofolate synthase [Magnetococcales bacterium]